MLRLRASLIALALSAGCGPAGAAVPPSNVAAPLAGGSGSATPRSVAPPSAAPPLLTAAPASVVWTSPPTVPPTPTLAATPFATAAPPPTRPPTPSARSAAPRAAPPTADPVTWHGYVVNGGPTLWVPSAWIAIEPIALKGLFWFAASPAPPSSSLGGHEVLVTLNAVKLAAPGLTVDAFADKWQKTLSPATKVLRDRAELGSGPAVLLTYEVPGAGGVPLRHIDAVLVRGDRGYLLGLHAPRDRWDENAALFGRILRLFEPAR